MLAQAMEVKHQADARTSRGMSEAA